MFDRYAIFFVPQTEPLASVGAAWLGWDSVGGCARAHPDITGLDITALTRRPRPYGLHATIKAPFHLAAHRTESALADALEDLCKALRQVTLPRVDLVHQHGFIALRPLAPLPALTHLETVVVQSLDHFRAPLTDAALQYRRKARLTDRQDRHLVQWGYPYVMEDFQFHITLSGRVDRPLASRACDALRPALADTLCAPLRIDALSLMGQGGDGCFYQIARNALTR